MLPYRWFYFEGAAAASCLPLLAVTQVSRSAVRCLISEATMFAALWTSRSMRRKEKQVQQFI